jgi:hypothetical protein
MSDTQSLQTIPSDEATYADQKSFGVIAGRSHVEISPKYGGSFKPTDVIRLEIPAQAYLDPNEFYIHFRTQLIAGAANRAGVDAAALNVLPMITPHSASTPSDTRGMSLQFTPGIQSIFNRIRLLAGSVVLEDIQDYNVLYRMLLEATTSKQWRETDGFTDEGVYDPENYKQRVANHNFHAQPIVAGSAPSTNGGHYYSIRPLFGLFTAGKYIPLKYMGQLTIELYLENAQECLWSSTSVNATPLNAADVSIRNFFNHASATGIPSKDVLTNTNEHLAVADGTLILTDFPNATYLVDEVRMHVPFIHPIESFDQAMMRQIESGDIAIFHSSWSSHTRQISAPSRTTLSFQERALSLKGALACMRNSPSIRAIDSDFTFPANGIEAYQWKLGSEYIPAQEISCVDGGGRALAELRKGLGIYDNKQLLNNITQENFLPVEIPHQLDSANFSELSRGVSQPSNFFMALDLEKSPGQASGFDSAASSVDIELVLKLRSHVSIVGQNPDTDADPAAGVRHYVGAHSSSLFQPSKRRVHFTRFPASTYMNDRQWGGDFMFMKTDDLFSSAATVQKDLVLSGYGGDGFMNDKNLIYEVAETAQNGYKGKYKLTSNAAGVYARVYLFAHIDQVLRLSAVGRMEIVR